MIYYQLACKTFNSSVYVFYGPPRDERGMFEVVSMMMKPSPNYWVVVAGSSIELLEQMLDRLNQGLPATACTLHKFRCGALYDDVVLDLEQSIFKDEQKLPSIMDSAIQKGMMRVFYPTPPRLTTKEGQGGECFSNRISPPHFSREEHNRLRFMYYLKERGVFNDDIQTERV